MGGDEGHPVPGCLEKMKTTTQTMKVRGEEEGSMREFFERKVTTFDIVTIDVPQETPRCAPWIPISITFKRPPHTIAIVNLRRYTEKGRERDHGDQAVICRKGSLPTRLNHAMVPPA